SFFFSSRRRHTRSKRDWSSDVCSSDLLAMAHISLDDPMRNAFHEVMIPARPPAMTSLPQSVDPNMVVRASAVTRSCEPSWSAGRSEERRVGKEGRARGWREQEEERGEG